MQAVEHRQGCQGNPDASRCLHRPRPASSPEDRDGDGGCASAANAPRGPCARHGCVGSDWPPRVARRRAPDSNNWECSSADRGRSGCTAGPGRSTVRTGTSGRNRPCAPRGSPSPRCWTDASQRATLWRHRLTRHGVGRGTVDQPPSDGPLPRPTTSASSRVVQRAARHPPQARRATARSERCRRPFRAHPSRHVSPASRRINGVPSPAWPPSGRPCRRRTHRRSCAVNQPSREALGNAKPRPHRRIGAVPDRRSQGHVIGAVLISAGFAIGLLSVAPA